MTAEAVAGKAAVLVVVFTVGPVRCGLRHAAVRALLPLPRLWRPPGLPRPLEGFLNLGGEAVPVLALDRLFGLPEAAATPEASIYRHLVLLDDGEGRPVALLVTRATEVLALPPGRLRPVDESRTLNGCVEAEIEAEGGFIHLLAPDRLLLEGERRALAELRRCAAERLREWGSAAP